MNKDTTFSAAHAGARRLEGFGFPISRRTDPVSIRPGTRVVVRHLVLNTGQNTNTVTDAIGVLRSVSPLQVDDLITVSYTHLTLPTSDLV